VTLVRPTLRLRMALLYGLLVLFVGISLLFTAIILLDRSISHVAIFNDSRGFLRYHDGQGHVRTVVPSQLGSDVHHTVQTYLFKAGMIFFGIVVIIGTIGGYLLAKQALRPIAKLTQTARALSTETLDQRINLGGPDDELRELADTFDQMLGRLDAAFDSQRLFVANASHELRTPLSVIRTEVDVTLGDPGASVAELRTMGEVVREASMRADRLVDALLVLARSDGQARQGLAQREPVDLASLVPAAVAAVASEASARGLAVSTETRPAPVEGDPQLLERLVGNLVENAVRHNVDGGWVTVRTGTQSGAFLSVLNTGPAVPAGEVDELFQPFRRGGTARTGSRGAGLGLSIVRAVAAAHGGAVSAAARSEGGLEVTVRLPAATRAPVPV